MLYIICTAPHIKPHILDIRYSVLEFQVICVYIMYIFIYRYRYTHIIAPSGIA